MFAIFVHALVHVAIHVLVLPWKLIDCRPVVRSLHPCPLSLILLPLSVNGLIPVFVHVIVPLSAHVLNPLFIHVLVPLSVHVLIPLSVHVPVRLSVHVLVPPCPRPLSAHDLFASFVQVFF